MAAVPVRFDHAGGVTLSARMVVYGEVRRKTRRDILITASAAFAVLTCQVYAKIIYF